MKIKKCSKTLKCVQNICKRIIILEHICVFRVLGGAAEPVRVPHRHLAALSKLHLLQQFLFLDSPCSDLHLIVKWCFELLISHAQVQLDSLLDVCPRLAELSVYFSSLQSVTQLRPDTLQRLQTLRVVCGHSLQPGLLLQVLLRMASHLRSVKLSMVDVDVHDLQQLDALARQRSCMQHLQHVQIHLPPGAAEDSLVLMKDTCLKWPSSVVQITATARLQQFDFTIHKEKPVTENYV
jgi:hypothetical protein